jgi:hypothetical protein
MRLLLLLPVILIYSCQNLYTDIPKGTVSDESITQLVLDYRSLSPTKISGSIQNNSKNRIYDVRVRISISNRDGSASTEHFVIAKINPYQNYRFKRNLDDTQGVEATLQIQSAHY